MLTALAHDQEGRPAIILGLTDLNLEKLRSGSPIIRDCAQVGFDGSVMVVAAHDLPALKARFVELRLTDRSFLDSELPEGLDDEVLWRPSGPATA